jgi:hypothetical protein
MRLTSARQLLESWEALQGQPMPVRAAGLAALLTGRSLPDALRWSVARRDRALFDFRAQMFGERVEAVTPCPNCAQPLEMQLPLAQIAPSQTAARKSRFQTLDVDGAGVRCRAPNSEDLLTIAGSRDLAEARAQLIARCIQTDDPELRERAAALLTGEAADDVELNLTCPACGHSWHAPFDIATFVWRELDDWAQRTLREIHVIAGAYGWSEDEILQLSARRRQMYVEMI